MAKRWVFHVHMWPLRNGEKNKTNKNNSNGKSDVISKKAVDLIPTQSKSNHQSILAQKTCTTFNILFLLLCTFMPQIKKKQLKEKYKVEEHMAVKKRMCLCGLNSHYLSFSSVSCEFELVLFCKQLFE